MITFGPVPSRRLGRSLGINNIPPKACSYSCVYCQVGSTPHRETEPRAFYTPDQVLADVARRIEAAERSGEAIDFLTFVPDGEPTLDVNLGETIKRLGRFGIPIAVISNASLAWRADVRERLAGADWLSLKVDTTDEALWQRINRPAPGLRLEKLLEGVSLMARTFEGELTTETMLVDGVNTGEKAVTRLADFLVRLAPARAYLAVPVRPAAEPGIHPPSEETINRAFQLLSARLPQTEYLIGYEGNAFATTGDLSEDLLAITSVHPMREDAVRALLARNGAGWETVSALVGEGRLKEVRYEGKLFYVRAMKPAAER